MNARTIIIIGLTLTTALAASVALAADEWTETIAVEPGQRIEVKARAGGSLEVEAWNRDSVRITCEDRTNDLSDYDFKLRETRSGLKFEAILTDDDIQNISLRIHLMVPREFDIDLESGGGGITIDGVTGTFEGRTAGGGITLTNVKGEADLKTGGGWIGISDSELDGKVSSGGGGALVENVVGDVRVTSGGGNVEYKNVRKDSGDLRAPGHLSAKGVNEGTVMYSSAGGAIRVKEAPEGAVVKTGGGNVTVRNAEKFVRASTGGGSIAIEVRNGIVEARTGAGEIEVEVDGGFGHADVDDDAIYLTTGHGDITLILPEDLSIELDLDLAYTRNSRHDFEIISDFDIDEERTQEWDTEHGTPRKHVYGTAEINGGKYKVVVRVVNGDIRVETR